MSKELELLRALERFETNITIDAAGVKPTLIEDAVAKNIKIAYYLESVTSSISYVGGAKYLLRAQYRNTQVPMRDIFVASSKEQIKSIFCQYVGNYKKRVVIFVPNGVNMDAAYKEFMEVQAPFYANLEQIGFQRSETSVCHMPIYDFLFDYRIGKVKLEMMEIEVDAEVERIANLLFLPGMPPATKVLLAHNYLACTVQYYLKKDASDLEKSYMHSAYGALIRKKCVCQGYAEAFKRLMDFAGIPCEVVCGQTKGSDDSHAWNLVKLNGEAENYHIDVTWDASGNRLSYDYFGLRDSDFHGERTWNRSYTPICNSPKNLLLEARRGLLRFQAMLVAKGVDIRFLGH